MDEELDDDLDIDIGDDDEPSPEPEPAEAGEGEDGKEAEAKKTRKEKRRERGEMFRENEKLRHENQEFRERLSRLEGETFARRQTDRIQSDPVADYYREMEGVYEEMSQLQTQQQAEMQQYKGSLPADRVAYYRRKASDLNLKQHTLAQQTASIQSRDPVAEDQARQMQFLQSRYPDLVSNPQAWAFCNGLAAQKKALGRQHSVELLDEVAEEARRTFKLGTYRNAAPTDRHSRDRHTGIARGAGVDGQPRSNGRFAMEKYHKELAEAQFPELAEKDPEKAHEAWMKSTGRRAMEKLRRGT